MSNFREPSIYLNNRTYIAKKPLVKDWYNFMEFENSEEDSGDLATYFDRMAGIIAPLFIGLEAKDIIEHMPLEDIKPTYQMCYRWLLQIINSKLGKLPNGETGKD